MKISIHAKVLKRLIDDLGSAFYSKVNYRYRAIDAVSINGQQRH